MAGLGNASSAVLPEELTKAGVRALSLSIAYRQRLPADEERAASAKRRMALRLLVELLCVGVSQDVAGVLGVLQGLVRAPATLRMAFWRGALRPPAGRWSAALRHMFHELCEAYTFTSLCYLLLKDHP